MFKLDCNETDPFSWGNSERVTIAEIYRLQWRASGSHH